MPDGVIAEVQDGFATIDFVNPSLRAAALGRLLNIGGPETIETITREGPRRKYRVPEGNAREAGLLDHSSGEVVRGDQGAAEALLAAHDESRAMPGIDAPTSRNLFVGETTYQEAREGGHVATTVDGADPYPDGTAKVPPHSEVIKTVAAAEGKTPILEGQAPSFEVAGAPDLGYPTDESPSEDWSRKQLDAYARRYGIDTRKAGTKAEVVALLENRDTA